MRLLADSNIVAQAVRAMRLAGHDVLYVAERSNDPGDEALLREAFTEKRVLVTKDRDMGALVHGAARKPHSGVLLLDDFGDPAVETRRILQLLISHETRLAAGAFLRANANSVREAEAT